MTEVIHKHHIIPKYKCKELGIDPNFDDNLVDVTRIQHALIHWGYKCNDLKPLLEVCNPPQYVIDMIPLGDNRDVGAATFIARGEIEQIDNSGENNYFYGKKHSKESIKKMSETQKQFYIDNPDKKPVGEKNGMYGKKHSPEAKEIFRQRGLDPLVNNLLYYTDENGDRVRKSHAGDNNGMFGKKHSKESIKKMSETQKQFYIDNPDKVMKGEKNPMFGKTGKNNPNYGRKNTEETKKKMSEQKIQFYIDNPDKKSVMTKEARKRLSKERSGQNNPMSRTNIERRANVKKKQQGQGTLEEFIK